MKTEQANILIENILQETIHKFQEYLNKTGETDLKQHLSIPEIEWKDMYLNIYGKTYEDEHIELNALYLKIPHAEEFIREVILHQFAHVLTLRIFKTLKHDHTFKHINKILGGSGFIVTEKFKKEL